MIYGNRMKNNWIPPASPFSLIQEHVWPNEWLILVVCIMLNQTSRKQVEKILPTFIKKWSEPRQFLDAKIDDVKDVIKSLGFVNRRADLLFKMSHQYVINNWSHASSLPGIGDYGSRAWEIFCLGLFGDIPPKDHALTKYWQYCKRHNYDRQNNT